MTERKYRYGCSRHPRYKGQRPPRIVCNACDFVYNEELKFRGKKHKPVVLLMSEGLDRTLTLERAE